MLDWFMSDWQTISGIFISIAAIYGVLIILVKANGLRSFSKMSGHDFAVTVAIGSIIASTILSKDPPVMNAAIAIGGLLLFQNILSRFRIWSGKTYLENKPLLLMDGGQILEKNLKKANITRNDLISKLREANALNFNDIHAVVVETTGDISVLHGNAKFDRETLLDGVQK